MLSRRMVAANSFRGADRFGAATPYISQFMAFLIHNIAAATQPNRQTINKILQRMKRVLPDVPLCQPSSESLLKHHQPLLLRTFFRVNSYPNKIVILYAEPAK